MSNAPEFDDAKIAHMNMVQAVIARMASNSFSLKVLAMTLSSAILALVGSIKEPSIVFPLAAIFPILIFWFLDAKYLRLEKLFRELFDDIRGGHITPFLMSPPKVSKKVGNTLSIALTWSVAPIYIAILVVLLVVSCTIK